MNKNTYGFGTLELLLIIVLVGIISGTGWYVWSRNKPKDISNTYSASQPQAENKDKETSEIKNNIEIQEVNIEITNVADLLKLPENTPKGFVDAFGVKVKKWTDVEFDGCTTIFYINKVSPINVRAELRNFELKDGKKVEESMICGGGQYSIWGLKNNQWIEAAAGNGEIGCQSITSPKIYTEFVDECWDSAAVKYIPNHNGSIYYAKID